MHTHYFTDPACPWSWALEPALRRLEHELGENLFISHVMCGMAREFGETKQLALESLDAAERSGMPVDVRLWLEAPPASSYPACIAVKAAADQGRAAPYLRLLREGLMCRRRKLDTAEALREQARAVAGLELERFQIDLASHATLESFSADLERARAVPADHQQPGSGRVKLPSLEFRSERGDLHGVYGYADYETLRQAALSAGGQPTADAAPSIEQALGRFGTMTTAEVAAVCQLPGPRAPEELWRLASEWRVKPERLGTGELWTLARL